MNAPLDADLSGKTAIVTGSNQGIGREIARDLAKLGADVVLAVRSVERGEEAKADLARDAKASVRVMPVDLSSQASIRAFAKAALDVLPRLDILVNNAGIWLDQREVSVDGIEKVWATNVLGYFLLTELLRPRLVESGRARIVNVASGFAHGLDLADVGFERRRYSGSASYAQSKQANRMWTWALARRLAGTGVTANALHPGTVDTQLLNRGFPGVGGRTTAQGADTASWLAADRSVEGVTGKFFADRHERRCEFHDERAEEALWALCAQQTGGSVR